MKIYLPIPPSSNMIFRTTKGKRYKTTNYNDWLRDGSIFLLQQKIPTLNIKRANIELYVPKLRANSDIDNRIKPVLDLLVKCNVILDDRYIDSIYAKWIDKNSDCYVEIKDYKC